MVTAPFSSNLVLEELQKVETLILMIFSRCSFQGEVWEAQEVATKILTSSEISSGEKTAEGLEV